MEDETRKGDGQFGYWIEQDIKYEDRYGEYPQGSVRAQPEDGFWKELSRKQDDQGGYDGLDDKDGALRIGIMAD